MALTEPKGTREEQDRAMSFIAAKHAAKERAQAEEAAQTSEQRTYEDGLGNTWKYVVFAGREVHVEG